MEISRFKAANVAFALLFVGLVSGCGKGDSNDANNGGGGGGVVSNPTPQNYGTYGNIPTNAGYASSIAFSGNNVVVTNQRVVGGEVSPKYGATSYNNAYTYCDLVSNCWLFSNASFGMNGSGPLPLGNNNIVTTQQYPNNNGMISLSANTKSDPGSMVTISYAPVYSGSTRTTAYGVLNLSQQAMQLMQQMYPGVTPLGVSIEAIVDGFSRINGGAVQLHMTRDQSGNYKGLFLRL